MKSTRTGLALVGGLEQYQTTPAGFLLGKTELEEAPQEPAEGNPAPHGPLSQTVL